MRKSEAEHLVLAAIISAGAMIAFQVGGKATRDAVFLSIFPVTALPSMLIASSAVSIVAVLVASRLISTKGPAAIIPFAFGASSILLVAEWMAFAVASRAVATLLYLHMAGFGAILVSGFWSIVSELFDPRTAKAKIGRIAAGGTLGGLLGGVIAERTGALLSVTAMLPVLATLHLFCAILNRALKPSNGIHAAYSKSDRSAETAISGFRVLKATPYLSQMAILVMLGTVAETLLDYVLKAQALGTFTQGQELMRFFALFYTAISLVTFLVQAALSRYSLQRFGLTATMSTMPFAVAAGGFGALIWPGLLSTGFVRAAQSVLRSSLFRSGYELLYGPVPPAEKRAAKTIVDVGFDKLGDALGAGVIRLALFAAGASGMSAVVSNRMLMVAAAMFGGLALVLTMRLSGGYVATLEKSLLNQAADLEFIDIDEKTTRATMMRTLGTVDLRAIRLPHPIAEKAASEPVPTGDQAQPLVKRMLDLEAENAVVVRHALASEKPLDPLLIAPAIRLLARDDVSEDAVAALRTSAAGAIGQLTDALVNPDEDFAVRRRIPRVLAYCSSPRAVEGLMRGLADSRFEVRFSCGRALSRICSANPTLNPPAESVYAATLQEIATAKRLSEIPKVLDRYDDQPDPTPAETSWNSTDVRLEHIFRLLALCLPRELLHIAFQALHTSDTYLQGTALEYLESILPSGIRESLVQFLEASPRPATNRRPADHIAAELMQSRAQIELKLSLGRSAPSARNA
jgi:ATP:ADP antiporter, AAA family